MLSHRADLAEAEVTPLQVTHTFPDLNALTPSLSPPTGPPLALPAGKAHPQ
jgi:hypothetical protein